MQCLFFFSVCEIFSFVFLQLDYDTPMYVCVCVCPLVFILIGVLWDFFALWFVVLDFPGKILGHYRIHVFLISHYFCFFLLRLQLNGCNTSWYSTTPLGCPELCFSFSFSKLQFHFVLFLSSLSSLILSSSLSRLLLRLPKKFFFSNVKQFFCLFLAFLFYFFKVFISLLKISIFLCMLVHLLYQIIQHTYFRIVDNLNE